MKLRFTLMAVFCLLVSSVSAHRYTYVTETLDETLQDSWTVEGADAEADEGFTLLAPTAGTVTLTKTYDDLFECPKFGAGEVTIIADAPVQVSVAVIDADGNEYVVSGGQAEGNELDEKLKFENATFSAAPATGKGVKVIISGADQASYVVVSRVKAQSPWITPRVSGTVGEAVRIEAEDYDEGGEGVGYIGCTGLPTASSYIYREDYLTGEDNHPAVRFTSSNETACSNNCAFSDGGVGDWPGENFPADLAYNQENCEKYFGWTTFYTIDVPTDVTVDVYSAHSTHPGPYPVINANGNHGIKDRLGEWGGFNYVARYTACAVLMLDGEPVKANPEYTLADQGFSSDSAPDFDYTAGNDTVLAFCNGVDWNFTHKRTHTGVELKAGKHQLGFKLLAPQAFFDYIELKTTGSAGVKSVAADKASNLIVYPSVADDVINIAGVQAPYAIYSLAGQLVAQGTESSVNVSNLNKGVYLVKVGSEVKKFIKK
ncbi:MAG: T9SS type A sorting domain-containing protein [Muribaculaceae bacterium]